MFSKQTISIVGSWIFEWKNILSTMDSDVEHSPFCSLDDKNSEFFYTIFNIIYSSCRFEYIEVDGVKYAQAQTIWRDEKSEHHQASECQGYYSHTDNATGEDNSKEYNHSLPKGASVIFGIEKALNVSEFPFEDYETENAFFEGINLTTIFQSRKTVILRNLNGINEDHRGSDHFKYEIPFEGEVVLRKKFTMDQLIDALYRIKSHHTDNWYELFCRVKITDEDDQMVLICEFDHGS